MSQWRKTTLHIKMLPRMNHSCYKPVRQPALRHRQVLDMELFEFVEQADGLSKFMFVLSRAHECAHDFIGEWNTESEVSYGLQFWKHKVSEDSGFSDLGIVQHKRSQPTAGPLEEIQK
jgi:hypothetical protein